MRNDVPTHQRNRGQRWSRLAGVALVAAVVVSALAVTPVMAQEDTQTFIVRQGDKCIQVTPLGDGSQSVEAFYDYRSPITEPEGLYSSYGTTDIQQSQVSQLFVYRGSEGLSLVFLHDKLGDETGGFVATGDISGLPSNGEWAVEDDSYNNRDDVFRHSNGSSHIEWLSNGNRTDGAAFRGLGSPQYSTITVDIAFNEESANYPFEGWSGSPEQNQIEQWIVRSGTGETTQLDMSQPVKISPGTCSGGVSTFTATPASTDNATTGTTGSETPGATAATTQTMATTAAQTETPTATQTQTETPTATPTQTATATPTATPTTQSSADETTGTTGTGGLVGTTTTQTGGDGGSGAFGPGFGVGLALVAVVALAVVVLARRHT
jgi:hypothetical protein